MAKTLEPEKTLKACMALPLVRGPISSDLEDLDRLHASYPWYADDVIFCWADHFRGGSDG